MHGVIGKKQQFLNKLIKKDLSKIKKKSTTKT